MGNFFTRSAASGRIRKEMLADCFARSFALALVCMFLHAAVGFRYNGGVIVRPRSNSRPFAAHTQILVLKRGSRDAATGSPQCSPQKMDATTRTIRAALDIMRDSPLIENKHAEHCASPSATHLFKGTALIGLPDKLKLRFVDSWAGKMLATVMAEEQIYLGDWKIAKIVEAAGEYDSSRVAARISRDINSSPVLVYSFVDCPWCAATKDLLKKDPYDFSMSRVVELEECGLAGKHIRAELAKLTGRTSMPSIFVRGKPIGGFTDGDPCGPGLKALHESGELLSIMHN